MATLRLLRNMGGGWVMDMGTSSISVIHVCYTWPSHLAGICLHVTSPKKNNTTFQNNTTHWTNLIITQHTSIYFNTLFAGDVSVGDKQKNHSRRQTPQDDRRQTTKKNTGPSSDHHAPTTDTPHDSRTLITSKPLHQQVQNSKTRGKIHKEH